MRERQVTVRTGMMPPQKNTSRINTLQWGRYAPASPHLTIVTLAFGTSNVNHVIFTKDRDIL